MARKVVLATGVNIKKMFSDAPFTYKKRELLVFDLELSPEALKFPHTVVPLAHGLVFSFIKNIDGRDRFVLGQEDLLEYSDTWEEENFLPQLIDLGLYNLMPFLKGAKVEKVLWGFDSVSKFPEFYSPRASLLAVTCGSAVRSCVWIGRKVTEKMLE
jgi:hypothetical protein